MKQNKKDEMKLKIKQNKVPAFLDRCQYFLPDTKIRQTQKKTAKNFILRWTQQIKQQLSVKWHLNGLVLWEQFATRLNPHLQELSKWIPWDCAVNDQWPAMTDLWKAEFLPPRDTRAKQEIQAVTSMS